MKLTTMRRSKNQTKDLGQGLIEFALIVGILLFILGGTFDLGNLLFTYIELLDAAEEGVQFGSFCPNGAIIESRVRANSDFPIDLDGADVIVNSSFPSGTGLGNPITVEVRYVNLVFLLPFTETLLGNTIWAHATSRIISPNSCQ